MEWLFRASMSAKLGPNGGTVRQYGSGCANLAPHRLPRQPRVSQFGATKLGWFSRTPKVRSGLGRTGFKGGRAQAEASRGKQARRQTDRLIHTQANTDVQKHTYICLNTCAYTNTYINVHAHVHAHMAIHTCADDLPHEHALAHVQAWLAIVHVDRHVWHQRTLYSFSHK